LSQWFPFPADNGSKIRIYHLLQGLSQVHNVTLFSFYDPKTNPLDRKEPYPFCAQVQLIPWKSYDAKSRKAALGFFSLSPRSLLDTHSPEMETMISNAVASRKFDLILASQLTMASYFPVFGGVPAIFEELELGLLMDQAFRGGNWMRRLRSQLTWFKLRQFLLRLLESYAACTVVSEQERQIFTEKLPSQAQKVEVLPNCISLDDFKGVHVDHNHCRIIYAGSFRYKPNYQAMQWFIGRVFPLVLQQIPEVELIITGDHANLPLPSLEHVKLAGYVDDIKSLVASCDVSLAPLWSGGGTRLKILEAMALGTPVVATAKGAEGLLVQHGRHLLIADEPEKFAEHVVQLLKNKDLRNQLSENALQLVKEHYDWPGLMPKVLRLVERAASG
jgi:glycosyltransferase involved in cell wall biosynthesis